MARTTPVNLRSFREAARVHGISLTAFARGALISRGHLYEVLRGNRRPGPALAAKITRFISQAEARAA